MPAVYSRPKFPKPEPEPWPSDLHPDGSIRGDLPLTVPRPRLTSIKVVIVKRQAGISHYDAQRKSGETYDPPVRFQIDTYNESILLSSLAIQQDGTGAHRMTAGNVLVSRIVGLQQPSSDPVRTYVDHSDGDSRNDTAANLHWVWPSFNAFNMARVPGSSGLFGVTAKSNGKKFSVTQRGLDQGDYHSVETAALVYNLVCRLHYGSQLDKTPRVLNPIDEQGRVQHVESFRGAEVHKVDELFLVVLDAQVKCHFATLEEAKPAANAAVAEAESLKKLNENTWADRRAMLDVARNANGIAFFAVQSREGTPRTIEVLVDDEDWKDIVARGGRASCSRHNRIVVRFTGSPSEFLSRYLLADQSHEHSADFRTLIVDHHSGDIFDHRRANLRIVDHSTNRQNSRLPRRKESGYIGVAVSRETNKAGFVTKKYKTDCRVRGEARKVARTFEFRELHRSIELYDVTSVFQYGAGSLVNFPDKTGEYLEMLEDDAKVKEIETFLAGKRKTSRFIGVHLACVNRNWYWIGRNKMNVPTPVGTQFPVRQRYTTLDILGQEVRAAICADLYRLKHLGPNMTLNFERMRPYYQYLVRNNSNVSPGSLKTVVQQAYEVFAGDAYALAMADEDAPTSSPSPSASSSAQSDAPLGDARNPIVIDASPPSSPPPVSGPRPKRFKAGN